MRWRLNQNDCQNRGYVLDGYPKSLQQAGDVFVVTPKAPEKKRPAEGEEEDEEPPAEEEDEEELNLKPQLQTNIYPESVVHLRATTLFLKRRAKGFLQEAQRNKQKWHIANLQSKIDIFNQQNSMALFREPGELFPTTKFFQDNGTDVFEMAADGDKFEMFESMRIYIERFGRPYNYLKSVKHLNQKREEHLREEEAAQQKGSDHEHGRGRDARAAQALELEKKFEERLKHIRSHMGELEQCDDLNMRQFLMKYIIPVLTEGMIDVWKVGPLDPVDYLAEYIFTRSKGA